mmetsp:Transcript_15096/g.38814  ORF Transcript_15096/g.38814 Transcript_15096/m.38814 type:complete len:722 (-) Transcript_15096:234-2399(-)
MGKFTVRALGACMLTAAAQSEVLSWDEAYAKAGAKLAEMLPAEKMALMQGVGWDQWQQRKWWYVGNTVASPRAGIPSLNMQDASDGFRTSWHEIVGTVTSWPSMLSLAATWNPRSVHEAAVAIGKEFSAKGGNVVLGPSVNVHRVARGGRNFEYLSGEDPYLGGRLAEAYVEGVQSEGCIASIKHWAFNQQEENRGLEDSIVDEKTARELYYPPFEASIDAGVAAAMCAYNKVNGVYACANEQLFKLLKEELGFRGFVQSDWWATHNTSLGTGLDQEMPGANQAWQWYSPELLSKHPQSTQIVDQSALRILAAMYKVGIMSREQACTPPACESTFQKDVSSRFPGHAGLSRSLATESVVLLQNKDQLLPLRPGSTKSIAVIGSAAVSKAYDPDGLGQGQGNWAQGDYYSGGGSGHVVAGHVVSALAGLKRRAAAAGIAVIESTTDDVDAAVAAAMQADVTIVVAATTSGEASDRADLNLDNGANGLISEVAKHASKTVVLAQVPGAVVMPWRDQVSAILTLFLGGQETGAAWANIVFGDEAPAGRLPIMMPASEADTIAPATLDNLRIEYSEGMKTSYRSPTFQAAFPFGHGLTYSTFEYLAPEAAPCKGALCLRLKVRNSGAVAARAVPQLYLQFPPEAKHPSALLKGFQKTGLIAPGDSADVEFRLSDRDLSYYSVATGAWVKAGQVTAQIGESSADIRQLYTMPTHGDLRSSESPLFP